MYKQLSHEHLCTLGTCQLLSEHEQQLNSAENYRKCFLKLVQECTPLKNYLEENIVPWPADWPSWYCPIKKIAQGKRQLRQQSVIPEQGQFHVSLNAAEDTVLIFKDFLMTFTNPYLDRIFQKENMFNCCLVGVDSNPGESATKVWHLQRPSIYLSHLLT